MSYIDNIEQKIQVSFTIKIKIRLKYLHYNNRWKITIINNY